MLLNPSFPLQRSIADTLRAKLIRWEPESAADSTRRDYLLGLVAARVGDSATALGSAERLESRAVASAAGDALKERRRRQDLSLSIRADVAWRAGRVAQALALLDQRHPNVWYPPEMDRVDDDRVQLEGPFQNQAYERWMRAELLNQLGRRAEAVDWYAGLGVYIGEDMGYLPPARLRMGEISEQLGDTTGALEQYARVARLWSNCEPELRPRLHEIHSKLARLRSSN